MIRTRLIVAAATTTLLALPALLSGCSDDSDSSAAASVAPATVTVSGVAADGPLQGATACYDLNDNAACDPTEPKSGPTDANGKFSFDVAAAEAGKHRVIVEVPATAIDKDTGAAVGIAFTLVAPATSSSTQPVFVSPLTTLVQAHIDDTGATLTAATDFIKAQAALTVSPLADYTAASDAGNKQAGALARLVVLTTQKQTEAVASVSGQTDISGAKISDADLKKAVRQAIVFALPGLAAAVADPVIAAAKTAELPALLATAATTVVAQTGLTAETVIAAVGVAKLPADTSTVSLPTASATLTAFRYTNADNWFYRTLESSAADNTPDAAGNLRFYSVYKQSASSNFSSSGVVNAWGVGTTLQRAGDLSWNGSAWVDCPLGARSLASVRDAAGRSVYNFCDKREEGVSVRSAVDLTGKPIADVFRDTIRKFPGGINGVNYADWGPSDLAAAFGSAVFPANSKLFYQTSTVTKTAFSYDVQPSAVVSAFTLAVAAGGDARSGSPACSAVTPSNFSTFQSPVTTIEDLVARNPGKPCVSSKFTNADGTSLDPNEWWGNSTASIGTVSGLQTLPAGTGNQYTTTGLLRVGFAASGNGVTYYNCLQRKLDGSPRNCSAIGSGTYAVQTLGDARVMTFNAQPALAQRLNFVRTFVERGGKVYFGSTSLLGTNTSLRLNLDAANAVFKPLGMPPIRPVTRAADFSAATAAAFATAKGVYGTASATDATILRFSDGGRFLLGEAKAPSTATREQSGGELGFLDFDTATGRYASLLEVDSNLTAGTSHPGPTDSVSITSTQIVTSDGFVIPRLASNSGIVGLWALGSATDLSVNHFAFFPNGRVLHVDSKGDTEGGACTAARQGPAGAEFASYAFNAANSTLRIFGKLYDTDGCAGFFDSSAGAVANGTANTEVNFTVALSADGKTATVTGGGTSAPLTIFRIPSQ